MTIVTGLTGNDIFCLEQKNFLPGNLAIGNNVCSLGVRGKIASEAVGTLGLESKDITHLINKGRQRAYENMLNMADKKSSISIINITHQLILHSHFAEFLVSGSQIQSGEKSFSTSTNGQELYVLLDAGYEPFSSVFGSVAFSTGMTGGLLGKLKAYSQGEVKKFSESFDRTRRLVLKRLTQKAKEKKANAIISMSMTNTPYTGVSEMFMQGTAVYHSNLPSSDEIITSNLTLRETWSLAKLGYAPLRILLKSSVYSLGFASGMSSFFKTLLKENVAVTRMIEKARKNVLHSLNEEAARIDADRVVGVKTYVYPLGNGLIEFLALGTAIKKSPGITTLSDVLPWQAI